MGDRDAELGQHPVHLVLQRGTRLDQLVPAAGDLAQLADLRRGDPRPGQPAHPQQVRQVRGVPLVVLDPPAAERLDAQRVGQVHLGPGRLEHVHGPVPAVRRLDDDPRVLPRLGDLAPQRGRAAGDPDGLQLASVLGHPDDHAAPPVQVDPDDLPAVVCFRHRGPPLPDGDGCFAPSSIRQERRPAPSSHQAFPLYEVWVSPCLKPVAGMRRG